MTEKFIERYGFSPPESMNDFEIEQAVNASVKFTKYYFFDIFKKEGIYTGIEKRGYKYYEQEVNNIYILFYDDNYRKVRTSQNLTNILIYGSQTLKPFKIGYFKKLDILAITTNVPISYLELPKINKKTLVIQEEDNYLFTEQFSAKVRLYQIKENYIYKKYMSIEHCGSEKYSLELDYEKIFKDADSKGYKNLDKFLVKYVLI